MISAPSILNAFAPRRRTIEVPSLFIPRRKPIIHRGASWWRQFPVAHYMGDLMQKGGHLFSKGGHLVNGSAGCVCCGTCFTNQDINCWTSAACPGISDPKNSPTKILVTPDSGFGPVLNTCITPGCLNGGSDNGPRIITAFNNPSTSYCITGGGIDDCGLCGIQYIKSPVSTLSVQYYTIGSCTTPSTNAGYNWFILMRKISKTAWALAAGNILSSGAMEGLFFYGTATVANADCSSSFTITNQLTTIGSCVTLSCALGLTTGSTHAPYVYGTTGSVTCTPCGC